MVTEPIGSSTVDDSSNNFTLDHHILRELDVMFSLHL